MSFPKLTTIDSLSRALFGKTTDGKFWNRAPAQHSVTCFFIRRCRRGAAVCCGSAGTSTSTRRTPEQQGLGRSQGGVRVKAWLLLFGTPLPRDVLLGHLPSELGLTMCQAEFKAPFLPSPWWTRDNEVTRSHKQGFGKWLWSPGHPAPLSSVSSGR